MKENEDSKNSWKNILFYCGGSLLVSGIAFTTLRFLIKKYKLPNAIKQIDFKHTQLRGGGQHPTLTTNYPEEELSKFSPTNHTFSPNSLDYSPSRVPLALTSANIALSHGEFREVVTTLLPLTQLPLEEQMNSILPLFQQAAVASGSFKELYDVISNRKNLDFSMEIILASCMFELDDSKIFEHLKNAMNLAGDDLRKQAEVYKMFGKWHAFKEEWDVAESYFRNAIEAFEKNQKSLKDILKCFEEIQTMLISQSKAEQALEIETKEIENQITTVTKDDIDYYWHLTHVAHRLVEYNYVDLAELQWKKIISMYDTLYQQLSQTDKQLTDFENRVVSIYLNSQSDLCGLYYNQEKTDLHKQTLDKISHHLTMLTTSKYFDVTNCEIIVIDEPNSFMSVEFRLRLKIRNCAMMKADGVKGFRLIIEREGQLVVEKYQKYNSSYREIVLYTDSLNKLEEGIYLFKVEVISEGRKPYYHLQYIKTVVSFPPNSTKSDIEHILPCK